MFDYGVFPPNKNSFKLNCDDAVLMDEVKLGSIIHNHMCEILLVYEKFRVTSSIKLGGGDCSSRLCSLCYIDVGISLILVDIISMIHWRLLAEYVCNDPEI